MFEALLADFHFLRPLWLAATVPALLLALLWAKQRFARSHWQGRIDPLLLDALLEESENKAAKLPAWALALTMALGGFGLAGPTWERLPQPVEQANDALVIVLDLSLSMFAQDVPPSRLVRARQEITDVLRLRREGLTALVAYAGDAHAVAPLTDDTRTIENLLSSLTPAMMPVLGSNLSPALEVAQELFRNAGISQGRILIVTDGVDRAGDVSEARDSAFPISILGIGTGAGGPIPLDFANQPGRHLQTNDGDTILAKLDEQRLAQLAGQSYGRYQTATIGDQDIEHLLASQLPSEIELQQSERSFDTWSDRGYWLAIACLPLLLLLLRRGTLAGFTAWMLPTLLGGLALPPPAHAGIWDDLWARRDQQAHQQLTQGQPEAAAITFVDPNWAAAANYRSGNYAKAAEHFGSEQDPTNRYNLANASAHLGDFEGAIALYDKVLQSRPDHEDAKFNKALLEKLLDEQQQASDQDNNEQQDQGGEDADQERQDQSDNDQQQDSEQQGQDESEDSQEQQSEQQEQQASEDSNQTEEQELAEAQQSRDENTDALEQWLRRVPDDPGGLLKRKFQYETNQRRRQGEYRKRETEKIW